LEVIAVSTDPAVRRVPGWQRVHDAFISAPDRTLTNFELGAVPGVQAFHQRLSDLTRFGYVLTPAVKLAPGYYAYTLVGVKPDLARPDGKAPHHGLSVLRSDLTDRVATAVEQIKAQSDRLLARRLAEPEQGRIVAVQNSRAVRDATDCLADVVGEQIADEFDRNDLLVLAHTARDEIKRLRAAQTPTSSGRRRAPSGDRGPTGPDLMRRALEHHEQPMHSGKIAEWVMENGGDKVYKGLTPAATMAAQLATSNKDDGEFVKVAPGCYALREWKGKEDDFGNPLLELEPAR
jgi:hypothetical protein